MTKNSQLMLDIGQGIKLAIGLPTMASWDSKNRPKNAKRGTFGFNLETQSLEYFDGSDWYHAQMKGL